MQRLDRSFFARNPETVARELIGKIVEYESKQGKFSGIIVETEAYLADKDEAAHAARRKTKANQSLYKDAGHLYIHQIHRYSCMDFVCNFVGTAGSVLIRALQPLEGINIMQTNRNKSELTELMSGPGKLTQAMGIDKKLDGLDFINESSPLKVFEADSKDIQNIENSQRIGISKSTDLMLRFFLKDNPHVSK